METDRKERDIHTDGDKTDKRQTYRQMGTYIHIHTDRQDEDRQIGYMLDR